MLRGNIVMAAVVLGVSLLVTGLIGLLGAALLLDRMMGRAAVIAQQHGQSIQNASTDAGVTARHGVEQMVAAVQGHADAIREGGASLRLGFGDLANPVVEHVQAIKYAGDQIHLGLDDLRTGVDGHSVAIRDAGTSVGLPMSEALMTLAPAVAAHGRFLGDTAQRIAQRPLELRVISPLQFDGPVPITGANEKGELKVNVDL